MGGTPCCGAYIVQQWMVSGPIYGLVGMSTHRCNKHMQEHRMSTRLGVMPRTPYCDNIFKQQEEWSGHELTTNYFVIHDS